MQTTTQQPTETNAQTNTELNNTQTSESKPSESKINTRYLTLVENQHTGYINAVKVYTGLNVHPEKTQLTETFATGVYRTFTLDQIAYQSFYIKFIAECTIPQDAQTSILGSALVSDKISVKSITQVSDWYSSQSKEFIQDAIRKRAAIIEYLKEPTEEQIIQAALLDRHVMQHFPEVSEDVIKQVVSKNPWAIIYVKKERQTKELIELALSKRKDPDLERGLLK